MILEHAGRGCCQVDSLHLHLSVDDCHHDDDDGCGVRDVDGDDDVGGAGGDRGDDCECGVRGNGYVATLQGCCSDESESVSENVSNLSELGRRVERQKFLLS